MYSLDLVYQVLDCTTFLHHRSAPSPDNAATTARLGSKVAIHWPNLEYPLSSSGPPLNPKPFFLHHCSAPCSAAQPTAQSKLGLDCPVGRLGLGTL